MVTADRRPAGAQAVTDYTRHGVRDAVDAEVGEDPEPVSSEPAAGPG